MDVHARLILVDDDESIRRVFANELREMGFDVETAADVTPARQLLKSGNFDLAILDVRLPGGDGRSILHEIAAAPDGPAAIMLTGHGDIEMAVACMRDGAYDFLTKPCSLGELEFAVKRALDYRALVDAKQTLARGHVSIPVDEELIGQSEPMRALKEMVSRIGASDETVLVMGESGTGKELVARAIWQSSPRRHQPFIAVNCAAVAETLLESELFGHEKGAFSGAERRRTGMFELATRGTLLLDEIGEMPPAMQAKLLRVLQSGEVRRVGGAEVFHVDVRVIASTNRLMSEEVKTGRFREDLYHRINTLEIEVPPLRERNGDLPLLVEHVLESIARRPSGRRLTLSPGALDMLRQYAWPGNVRELENVIKRAAVLCAGGCIDPGDLPASLGLAAAGEGSEEPAITLAEVERRHLLKMLQQNQGNKMKTARMLGITTKTLYNKLEAYGMRSE